MAGLFEDSLFFHMDAYKTGSAYRWLLKLPRTVFLNRPLLRLFEFFYKMSKKKADDVFAVLPEIEESLNQGVGRYNEDKKTFCNDLLVYLKTVKSFYKNILNADVQKISAEIEKISEKNSFLVVYLKFDIVTIYLNPGRGALGRKTYKRSPELLHFIRIDFG